MSAVEERQWADEPTIRLRRAMEKFFNQVPSTIIAFESSLRCAVQRANAGIKLHGSEKYNCENARVWKPN